MTLLAFQDEKTTCEVAEFFGLKRSDAEAALQRCDKCHPKLTPVIPNRAEGPVRNLLLTSRERSTPPTKGREGHEFHSC